MNDLDREVAELCSQYLPAAELSLDESLLLYKGRLRFKQFIRIKRARFGIKIFILSDIHGYLMAHVIYYGAQTDFTCDENDIDLLKPSERIVVVLLSRAGLLDKGYVVTLDNWYCSVRLAEYLTTRKTGLRGTIRANRGVPAELKGKNMNPISSAFIRHDNMLIVRFCDKRDVYLISTVDKAGTLEKERFLPGGNVSNYEKPTAIDTYNNTMSGVDKCDQIIAGVTCVRRTHAWFKKLGLHMLQRLLLNAHVLYCREQEKIKFLDFTRRGILHFTTVTSEPHRKRFRSGQMNTEDRKENLHCPSKFSPTEKKEKPQRRCRSCVASNQRKDTRYFCDTCTDKPPLCLNCFPTWHQSL